MSPSASLPGCASVELASWRVAAWAGAPSRISGIRAATTMEMALECLVLLSFTACPFFGELLGAPAIEPSQDETGAVQI